MKYQRTNLVLIIQDRKCFIERRVLINDLGELYVKYDGGLYRLDYFSGRSTFMEEDYQGRRKPVRDHI